MENRIRSDARCLIVALTILGLSSVVRSDQRDFPLRPDDPRWVRTECVAPWLRANDPSDVTITHSSSGPPEAAPAVSQTAAVICSPPQSCIREAVLCRGIGSANEPVNPGCLFPVGTAQIVLYLAYADAPSNTRISVEIGTPDQVLYRRSLLVAGSRRLALSVRMREGSFEPGQYVCRLLVNDSLEREIPYRVAN